MKFTESEDFKKDMLQYASLSARVKDLSKLSLSAIDNAHKSSILKQMIISIHEFDHHLKEMVNNYPEYYESYKVGIDNLIKENYSYLLATFVEFNKISKEGVN